jgi:hypothetical protein
MMVPTGNCRVATRIIGPVGLGAAAAWAAGAEAPRIIWLTPKAAPMATIKAPTISIIFRVSMTIFRLLRLSYGTMAIALMPTG